MPELPEVVTIKRYLNKKLVGKKIKTVSVLKPKSFIGKPQDIIGAKIIKVERRAKLLIISFSNQKTLLVHLKMSGQLIYKLKSQISNLKSTSQNSKMNNKYTRAVIEFSDGSKLFFNDLRIFGWMKITDSLELKAESLKFGPEPFSKEFTLLYLKEIFSRPKKAIKLVLMDQEKIAGIGNIYANEALFEARINPLKPAQKLSNLEIKKLREAMIKVLKEGIKYHGSSAADEAYIQPTEEKGSYQKHFRVYQQEGKKCKNCGEVIKRIKFAGRGTFFCPKCQK